MAIIPSTTKSIIGRTDTASTDGQGAFERYEPMLTVQQVKDRFLFGIPLVSMLPDPVTRKRAEFTDEMMKDAIRRGYLGVELELGIYVTPLEITRRLPFDRAEYRSLGFFRLPDAPVLKVTSLKVATANSTPVYTVPNEWVDPGQLKMGQLNIIPLMPAFVGQGGTLPSFDAGGAAWLSILGQSGWVGSYWQMTYIAGMEEGAIPVMVNELAGVMTAIDVLGLLAATNRIASYGLSLDAASQNVNSGGPQVYDSAIEKLELRKKTLMGKLKARWNRKFVVGNV
jgi:hypothetical protein